MDIESLVQENYTLLTLSGRLDATRATQVQEAMLAALGQGKPFLAVDCTRLEYVASMGLRCFLVAANSAKTKGGSLVFFGLNDGVASVFNMTGFSKFIPVVQKLEDAVVKLQEATKPAS
jgi:anti-anti-sigma factor